MRICLASKILKNRELEEVARIASNIGYEGIDVFGVEKHLPIGVSMDRVAKFNKICKDLGLKIVVLSTYVGRFAELGDDECEKQVDNFKRYMEIAQKLECNMIRVWAGGPKPNIARKDHWYRAAYFIQKTADYALSADIKIVLENDENLTATVESTLKLLRLIDRPNVGITYDPGNIYRVTPNYYGIEAVRRFGKKIFHVHVKDVGDNNNLQVLLGEGNLNYPLIFKALKEIGYQGFVTAECHKEPSKDMSDIHIAKDDFEKIKNLLKIT